MDSKEFTRSIAMQHLPQGDYTGWFEHLYQQAEGNAELIHWGTQKVNPIYEEWLQRELPAGEKKRALIVGCGLGDDAETTARYGFQTTAFDISHSAIEWCQKRFPHSPVEYRTADLFHLPDAWRNAFDLVMEAYTLQNFPEDLWRTAIQSLAGLVAPGGTFLVIAKARDDDEPLDKIPWPLSHRELRYIETGGLTETQFEDLVRPQDPNGRIFRVTYIRK